VTKLAIAIASVSLLTGTAMAQTINNAPQNSPAGAGDQVKQAPRTLTGWRHALGSQGEAGPDAGPHSTEMIG
jgi:hypothetical protein